MLAIARGADLLFVDASSGALRSEVRGGRGEQSLWDAAIAADGAAQVRIGFVGRFELAASHQREAADKGEPPFHPTVARAGVLQGAVRQGLTRSRPVAVESPNEQHLGLTYLLDRHGRHTKPRSTRKLQCTSFEDSVTGAV